MDQELNASIARLRESAAAGRRYKARVLTKPVAVEASAYSVVSETLSEIWETLVDPETTLELESTVYAAGRLGSKRGLGELQYFLHRLEDDRTFVSVLEVIAYEHQSRAVTGNWSDMGVESGSEVTVEPTDSGDFRVLHRFRRTLPPGTLAQLVSEHERVLKAFAKEFQQGMTRVFGASRSPAPEK